LSLGLIAAPGKLMNTPFSLVLGMVYTYLPFMVLPLYSQLVKMDLRLLEAAHDVIVGLGLDSLLLSLGLIAAPGKLMNTPFSLVLGMVYTYLPFMVLPLYSQLVKMDLRLLEAAQDLGATPWVAFWKITVPLSKAGIIAGSMLVFIPCIGEYVVPELLGGPETLMIGRVIWDELFFNNDWPMASALAVLMILLIIVPLALFQRYQAQSQESRR
jgi:putrescine transport system permease protein